MEMPSSALQYIYGSGCLLLLRAVKTDALGAVGVLVCTVVLKQDNVLVSLMA